MQGREQNWNSYHFPGNWSTTTVGTRYWELTALLNMILQDKNHVHHFKPGACAGAVFVLGSYWYPSSFQLDAANVTLGMTFTIYVSKNWTIGWYKTIFWHHELCSYELLDTTSYSTNMVTHALAWFCDILILVYFLYFEGVFNKAIILFALDMI